MPRYDIQRPSRSAQRLSEYQQFQQGQQAQQAAAMQQLGLMFNMSQQEVAQEIARANLEIAKSGQGIAQGRLDLDRASQPSEIRSREATAKYNEALAAGYAPEQASRLAYQAAQTAETQARAAGITQENTQRPQAFAASQAETAERTRQLREMANRLGIENKFAPEMGQLGVDQLRNTVAAQPFQLEAIQLENKGRGLNNERLAWQNIADPKTRTLQDAALVAGTEQTQTGTRLTEEQILAAQASLPYITKNADAALKLSGLQGGLIQAQTDRSNALLPSDVEQQMIQLANLPEQYAGQNALTAAQAQHLKATDAQGLFDRHGLTIPQMQERVLTPESYKSIGDRYAADEAQRAAVRAQEEAARNQTLQNTTPSVYSSGSSLGENLATGIYNLPAHVFNTVATGTDFIEGFLGTGHNSYRMRPQGDMLRDQRRGKHYASAFYDPKRPETWGPIPTARK
jgi:hypothetical protein